jgi:type VI secretion system secreted protein VgrG
MAVLDFRVHTGDPLSVRRFSVREAVSEPWAITIVARTSDPSLDLDAIVGQPASFHIVAGDGSARERRWDGVIRLAEQEQAEPVGLSTYRFLLVPALWLMSQRRDHRIYQHLTAPQIAGGLLDLWRIEHALALDAGAHPRLPFKVQYGETDRGFRAPTDIVSG